LLFGVDPVPVDAIGHVKRRMVSRVDTTDEDLGRHGLAAGGRLAGSTLRG
jgi:hypothetical protein